MNSWKILGLTSEATRQEVKKAYQALVRQSQPSLSSDEFYKIRQARDECFKLIDLRFESLMNSLHDIEVEEEQHLWQELKKGQINRFLKASSYDKTDHFATIQWILKFCQNPSQTLFDAHLPPNLKPGLLKALLSGHKNQLQQIDWDQLVRKKMILFDHLPLCYLSQIADSTFLKYFSTRETQLLSPTGWHNHYIALRRMRLSPDNSWVHQLDTNYKEENLMSQDILLLDVLQYFIESPCQDNDELILWLENLLVACETDWTEDLPQGPDKEFPSLIVSDYSLYLLRHVTQSPQPPESLPIGTPVPLPLVDTRLVKKRDILLDWKASFEQPLFLLWILLSLGTAYLVQTWPHTGESLVPVSLGISSYLLITLCWVPHFFQQRKNLSRASWAIQQGNRLSHLWCTSPPLVIDSLEIQIQNPELPNHQKIKIALLLKNLQRPLVLSKWINQWRQTQPLADGFLKSLLSTFRTTLYFEKTLKKN